jgi:single-stranded DNA-binding protein
LAKFGLAVDRAMSKNGETDFFNIVAWQKLAEICGNILKRASWFNRRRSSDQII